MRIVPLVDKAQFILAIERGEVVAFQTINGGKIVVLNAK